MKRNRWRGLTVACAIFAALASSCAPRGELRHPPHAKWQPDKQLECSDPPLPGSIELRPPSGDANRALRVGIRGGLRRRDGDVYFTSLAGVPEPTWAGRSYISAIARGRRPRSRRMTAAERTNAVRRYESYESYDQFLTDLVARRSMLGEDARGEKATRHGEYGELVDRANAAEVIAGTTRLFKLSCSSAYDPDSPQGDDMDCSLRSTVLVSPETKLLRLRVDDEVVWESRLRSASAHQVEAYLERGGRPALVFRAVRAAGSRLRLRYSLEAPGWGHTSGVVRGACWHRVPMPHGSSAVRVAFRVGTLVDWTTVETGPLPSIACATTRAGHRERSSAEATGPGREAPELTRPWVMLEGTLYFNGAGWRLAPERLTFLPDHMITEAGTGQILISSYQVEREGGVQHVRVRVPEAADDRLRVQSMTPDGRVDPEGEVKHVRVGNSDCGITELDGRGSKQETCLVMRGDTGVSIPRWGLPRENGYSRMRAIFRPSTGSSRVRVLVDNEEIASIALPLPSCE